VIHVGELRHIGIGRIHPLDPAQDEIGLPPHLIGRVGVTSQMGIEGRQQAEIADAGHAAQQVGRPAEMLVQSGQQGLIGLFDGGDGLGRDTQDGQVAPHFGHRCFGDHRDLGRIHRGCDSGGEPCLDKGMVLFGKAPAIVHAGPDHALITEQFENAGDDRLSGSGRIDRDGRRKGLFDVIENIGRILDDGPVGRLQDRDHEPSQCRRDDTAKSRVIDQPFVERNAALAQMGACLAGKHGYRHAVEDIGLGHGFTSSMGGETPAITQAGRKGGFGEDRPRQQSSGYWAE